jgi:tRNA pseudouridine55 synthase
MIKVRTLAEHPDQYMPEGGVLLVDKPLGWTSFDVVNKLRYALGKRLGQKRPKVGHAGTLDPLATGLLVICIGNHTKEIGGLQSDGKTYEGHFVLGATTASYDRETEPIDFQPVDQITEAMLEATRLLFLGKLNQYPPIFSAVKMDGKKLYEVARAGKTLDLETRPVEIFDFQLGSPVLIKKGAEQEVLLKPTVKYYPEEYGLRLPFVVKCSKGTYIRSLAFDFGAALGCGAYLGGLRRTVSGQFDIANAASVDAWVASLSKSSI